MVHGQQNIKFDKGLSLFLWYYSQKECLKAHFYEDLWHSSNVYPVDMYDNTYSDILCYLQRAISYIQYNNQ
jgi:hypothetical protein